MFSSEESEGKGCRPGDRGRKQFLFRLLRGKGSGKEREDKFQCPEAVAALSTGVSEEEVSLSLDSATFI